MDGNHENFNRLFSGEFPLVEIFGGRAYKIREHVYYLKRGDIFTIEGKTFMALGGAMSQDKDPETISSLYSMMRQWPGRTEGIDWWPEEIPNQEDMDNACRNLAAVGWKVDYVISHTCPSSQRDLFSKEKRKEDPAETMFQDLIDRGLQFTYWHFGHFHKEQQEGRFICHFNKVRSLIGFE